MKNDTEESNNVFHNNTLPFLSIELTRSTIDYEKEKVSFFASGFDSAEARENMRFLLGVELSSKLKK